VADLSRRVLWNSLIRGKFQLVPASPLKFQLKNLQIPTDPTAPTDILLSFCLFSCRRHLDHRSCCAKKKRLIIPLPLVYEVPRVFLRQRESNMPSPWPGPPIGKTRKAKKPEKQTSMTPRSGSIKCALASASNNHIQPTNSNHIQPTNNNQQ